MITDNLYPTSQNYGNLACTASIPDLTPISDSVGDSYYLGYVTYENYPQFLNISYPTNTDTECGFTTDEPQNHSWGYVTQVGVESFANLYYNDNGDIKAGYSGLLHRFINDGYMCNFNTANRIALLWEWMAVPTDSIGDNGTAWGVKDYSQNLFARFTFDSIHTAESLQSAIENDETLFTKSIRFAGADHEITAKYSDFDTNYHMCRIVDGNYTIFVRCYSYYMARNSVYANYYNGQVSFVPFFGYHYESENIQAQDIVIAGGRDVSTTTYMVGFNFNTELMFKPFPAPNPNFPNNYGINIEGNTFGNFYKYPNISRADLPSQQNYGGILYDAYMIQFERSYNGNFLYSIHDCLDIKDVWKLSYFYFKRQKDLTADTTPPRSTTYTTEHLVSTFNDTQNPLWEYVNGSYTQIVSDLQLWQYPNVSVTASTYEPKDLPPYEPGGDGDDQGSNSGSVLRPTTLGVGGTNGFITQYSLTAAQIAEIGRLLWYKFSDASAVEQYVKNYMFFTVSTTGTLNLSNLLDYFVSLRVYPFPLINVPSHAAAGQDMWIGAGIVPLTFSTNLHTINNYADYIDAGSCTIPRYYNDFRDFAHTQIMLYLPYCGTVQLNPADVVGSTLHAQYAVDFATGGVTAYVDCTTWDGSQFVIAVLTGSIGADIPLTASNAAQIAARIAGDALNFAGTVGEALSSDVGRSAQAIGSAATGDVVGAAIGVANTYAGRIGGALDVAQTGLQIATAEGVKMPMLSGGRGFGSFGAPQTAYVQIRRGIYAEGQQPPQGFKEAYGEAYAKPVQVSSCAGFTVFANVDTSGLQCDAMERDQVKKMMQAGIYI